MLKYRPEIDGLRAIAVIPVILFHAGFSVFSGGFIGVDIFFVISGYLIGSIIVTEMREKTFSIIGFYERRARRLLPALFFIMLLTTMAAWLVFRPQDLKTYSQSVISVVTFVSNFWFLSESGYFGHETGVIPLLHTWSLAIEEQFYILFPILLIITWRFGEKITLLVLFILSVFSLQIAQMFSLNFPDVTFLILLTRGWELLVGVFVAFYLLEKPKLRFNQITSIFGMILILISIIMFDEKMPLPSYLSLIPILGTVLIIIFTSPQTIMYRLLSNRLFVGFGLISYSLYLWHQPILAFAKYLSLDNLSVIAMIACITLSVGLAFLTWKYIEKPFRNKQKYTRKSIFLLSLISAIGFVAIGLTGYMTDGGIKMWKASNTPRSVKLYHQLFTSLDAENPQDNDDCRFNVENINTTISERILACSKKYGKAVFIVGDSHAIDLFSVITSSNKNRKFIVGITKPRCRPHHNLSYCQYNELLSFVKKSPETIELILFEQAGFYLLKGNGFDNSDRKMITNIPMDGKVSKLDTIHQNIGLTINYLDQLQKHAKLAWFGPRLEPHINMRYVYAKGCENDYKLRENQRNIFVKLDAHLKKMSAEANIQYISQIDAFKFDLKNDFMTCDKIYWSDGDHYSAAGEVYFGNKFDILHAADL